MSKIKINSKLILKLTALFAVICLALCSCSININVNGSDSESKTTVSEIGTLSVHYLDVGPVSYTHLDVYKRQVLLRRFMKKCVGIIKMSRFPYFARVP